MSDLKITSGVVIHGGVGTPSPEQTTPELDAAYRETLSESLRAGGETLRAGGSALDAVVEAVRIMEDSPLFNAGRGSNFDERGVITMDASVMDGATLEAGSVAGVVETRNPVELARLVMERSEHVMLIGEGADAFAKAQGLGSAEAAFFHTERRWADLQRAKESGRSRPNVLGGGDPANKSGTVGAVARNASGDLAAATSTGGMANKSWGRVGDSPIIAAGTYAGPHCAVSCTGWGEYFIKNAVAYDVHARMEYLGVSLSEAVHGVIHEKLEAQVPGSGGLVAIDGNGRVELCFNTPGMYRGWIDEAGEPAVAIYREG
jgi:L-asparaginase / beta-aspartyl-peptidase